MLISILLLCAFGYAAYRILKSSISQMRTDAILTKFASSGEGVESGIPGHDYDATISDQARKEEFFELERAFQNDVTFLERLRDRRTPQIGELRKAPPQDEESDKLD